MGVNSTHIWLEAGTSGVWTIDSFDIEFEDELSNTWIISLDDSRWD